MGTILILRPHNFRQEDIEISESHINIWLLPAIGSLYHILDVGFYLKNNHQENNIDHIHTLVPHKKPETTCLVTYMKNRSPESWRLIFRGKEPIIDQTVLSTFEEIKDPQRVPKSYSRWKVRFDPPIGPGDEKYIRIRYSSYDHPAYLDFFGGFLGIGQRIRIDLRLFDHREHAEFLDVQERLEDKMIPIHKSNVYLVASQARYPELFSPGFTYIRVLESPLWMAYLGRKPNLIRPRKRKMHIFSWKREKEESASSIDSHRIFVSFKTHSMFQLGVRIIRLISWIFLISVFVTPLIKKLYNSSSSSPLAAVPSWLNWLDQIVSYWLVVVIVWILIELKNWGSIKKFSSRIIRWIDRMVYGTKH